MVSRWNSSGIFPRIHHIAALQQSPRVTVKIERGTRKIHWTDYLHVDVQRHLMGIQRQQKKNASQMLNSSLSLNANRFGAGQWSFLGPGSDKKWYSISEDSSHGEWDRIAEQMMLTFAESTHPVFRSTNPLSRGVLKSKGGGKLSMHFCADQGTIETVFCAQFISVNQLSICGAVSNLCEECKTCHVRKGRLVLAGQSDPLFVPIV